jgi:hypothetical protein
LTFECLFQLGILDNHFLKDIFQVLFDNIMIFIIVILDLDKNINYYLSFFLMNHLKFLFSGKRNIENLKLIKISSPFVSRSFLLFQILKNFHFF